jgi:hypothetical protein
MNKQTIFGLAILIFLMQPLYAEPISRRATITGGGGNGRCTIEVSIDGAAEMEVSGDHGILTTLSGQTAVWRRFQCTEPLPPNPVDFRFVRTDGRGTVQLRQDPRNTGGGAVIRINDSKGGRETYAFDLWWHRFGAGGGMPGPKPQPPDHWPPNGGGSGPWPTDPPVGHWPGSGGFPVAKAIQNCQDAVTSRLNRDGYPYVTFQRTIPDNNPGRRDWVTGTVSGKRRFETTTFSFSCSVDFNSGRVRSVDVRRY